MIHAKQISAFCILGCLIFLIAVFYPFGNRDLSQNEPQGEDGDVETVTGSNNIASPSRPPLREAPETVPATLPIRPATGTTVIHLVDALGDPIPNGRITLASRTYESAWSDFEIKDVTQGTHTLVAEADGYFSATETVGLPASEPVELMLEYKCAFEIEVTDKNGKPAPGCEVSLLEGRAVPRPVSKSLVVVTRKNPLGDGTITLQRQNGKLYVADIKGAQGPVRAAVPIQGHGREPEYLLRSDQVFHLQTRMEELAPPASTLKLWDSIALLGTVLDDSDPIAFLRLKRATKILLTGVLGSIRPHDKAVISTTYTNGTGKCEFFDLPPKLYYLTATLKNARSEIHPLRPVDRSVTLKLVSTKENTVRVTVEKTGFQYKRRRGINQCEVLLAGIDSAMFASGETDSAGRFAFHPVRSGRYKLTATPPEDLNAKPSSISIEISVSEPQTTVNFDFSVDEGVTVSGLVIREDTKETLPNYPLQLMINKGSRAPGKGNWRRYAVTTTDSGGRFEFEHVLPGSYLVTGFACREIDSGYLPSGKAMRFCKRTDKPIKAEPHFQVSDKDIADIVYSVLPGVLTHFAGKVVTQDGEPMSDARVKLNGPYDEFVKTGGYSDSEGRFVLSVMVPRSDKPIEVVLRAELKAPPIQRTAFGSNGEVHRYAEDGGLAAEGETPLTFEAGDFIRGIRIVVKVKPTGHVLYGNIRTRDGETPRNPRAFFILDAIQIGHDGRPETGDVNYARTRHPARIEPDGSYRIEGLRAGPVELHIDPHTPTTTPEDIVLPPPVTYVPAHVELDIPEDVQRMRYDILLEEYGYIHGRVLDQDLKPLTENVCVRADSPDGGAASLTDPNSRGFFVLLVQPGHTYNLEVMNYETLEVYSPTFDGLKPPLRDLVFQVTTKEAWDPSK